MRGLNVFVGSFDWGGLIKQAGEAGGSAASQIQQQQAADAAKAAASDDAKKKLAAVVLADANLAAAMARAETSAAVKSPQQAAADKAAQSVAEAADAKVAAVLPANVQSGRVDAATDALSRATSDLQADPTNVDKQSLVDAWQKILARAQAGSAAAQTPGTPESKVQDTGGGFFGAVLVGPVKWWHAIAAVILAGGGVWLWRRK